MKLLSFNTMIQDSGNSKLRIRQNYNETGDLMEIRNTKSPNLDNVSEEIFSEESSSEHNSLRKNQGRIKRVNKQNKKYVNQNITMFKRNKKMNALNLKNINKRPFSISPKSNRPVILQPIKKGRMNRSKSKNFTLPKI